MDKKWLDVEKVPPQYLKEIGYGALKGKSDINPQWRIKAMTEVYGLCGEGWYHIVSERWTEEGAKGDRMCFVCVHVFIKLSSGEWSAPIVGMGGNTTIDINKNGLQSSDEGWKMAYTDALGTALKSIGVGSAVYEGSWDGSKYTVKPTLVEQPKKPALSDITKMMQAVVANNWDFKTAIEKAEMNYAVSNEIKQLIADKFAEMEQ